MDSYIRTDLASEGWQGAPQKDLQGVKSRQWQEQGVQVHCIEILDERAEQVLQKPMGRYVTLGFESAVGMDGERREQIACVLGGQLRQMMTLLCPEVKRVMVAGLGNRRITADALGPMAVDGITVTQHLLELDQALFRAVGQISVSALTPGVLGDTGMEAALLVAKAVQAAEPDLVIAVDALAARSVERLGCTVQLSDAGISPGSGVGNRRMALTRQTVGVPVIALGVPTVVHSSTLVRDALEKAGIARTSEQLEQVLRSGESFFVTPKECDVMLEELSQILALAIDEAARDERKMY